MLECCPLPEVASRAVPGRSRSVGLVTSTAQPSAAVLAGPLYCTVLHCTVLSRPTVNKPPAQGQGGSCSQQTQTQPSSRDLVISADSSEEYLSMSTLNWAKYAARWTVVRGCGDSAMCHINTELSGVCAGDCAAAADDGGVIQQLSPPPLPPLCLHTSGITISLSGAPSHHWQTVFWVTDHSETS